MAWQWDVRPAEFKALSPADHKRVCNRCYWRALRRPKLLVAAVALGIVNGVTLLGLSLVVDGWTIGPVAVRTLAHIAVLGVLVIGFARYVAHLLRDELRACATTCCLECWYDLTGNQSGVCPECGTPRRLADTVETAAAA